MTIDTLLDDLYFPEAIDSTMLSVFDACETKNMQEFWLRKVPVGRSIDLHAGGCMAKAFEDTRVCFYKHEMSTEDSLFHAFDRFSVNWDNMAPKEGNYKNFVNCWGAVEAYFANYPMESDYFQPYIKVDGEPAVEFKFAIPTPILHPVTGNPILFAGRADMIAQDEPHTCYVVDEKTTKGIGPQWPYQWDMRGQFFGYTYAARLMGFPCAGALVRGIGILQTEYKFAEKLVVMSNDDVEDWWKHALAKIERMKYLWEITQERIARSKSQGLSVEEQLAAMHSVPLKSYGDACAAYGGCHFASLCRTREPWQLYHDWETRIWNPLADDPTAESEDRMKGMVEMNMSELEGEGWG